MTKEQELAFYRSIQFLDGYDLLALKKMVEDQIEYAKHLKENFYLNELTDDFIYIVWYMDGSYHYMFKGAEAYNEYIGNQRATKLERKTKDLFPKFELLMEKGNGKERVYTELSQNETKADKVQFKQGIRQGYNSVPRA